MALYAELRRRNVFRVAAAYIVMGWLLLQVADVAFGFIDAPEWVPKALLTLLVLGFPPALAIAWIFEFTPQGLRRGDEVPHERGENGVTARRLDVLTIVAVLILAAWTFYEQVQPPAGPTTDAPAVAAEAVPAATPDGTSPVPPRSRPEPPPLELDATAVAVLPFANRSQGEDASYFVDGVHDDLLTQLARIGELRVISRTSVADYRDTTKNIKQIGEELNARNIVEGSVQRSGNRVRINAQLIDANTDKHLWADTFDRELTADNLFEIQSDIAGNIARALSATLGSGEITVVPTGAAPTRSQAAYDLYLRARAIGSQLSVGAPRERIELLEQAVAIDPEFALAVAEIGHQYTNLYWFQTKNPAHRQLGQEWLERARAMAPDDPQIHWYWADHLYHGRLDYDGALAELAKAERKLPNSADLYRMRGWVQRRAGNFDEAIMAFRQVVHLDPRDPVGMFDLAITYAAIDDFEGYALWRDRMLALELDPDSFFTYAQLDLQATGDLTALRQALDEGGQTDEIADYFRFLVAFLERDLDDAATILDSWSGDVLLEQHRLAVRGVARAMIAHGRGNADATRTYATAGLASIDDFIAEYPEDPRGHLARARALALLERPDEAKASADQGIALYPRSLDAFSYRQYLIQRVDVLALTATSVETATAIEELLATPGFPVTFVALLRSPHFDRHRDHAAFELLGAKYGAREL